ncbi:MAG: right-handed parallel beta-helix repeat-containing protein, partial [Candidatus Njordarchaeota archaeon]
MGKIRGIPVVLTILLVSSFLVVVSGSRASSIKTITGDTPPKNGDWIISNPTVVENEVLIINGSILIQDGGSLKLIDSIIYMNLTSDGEHRIEVYGGGSLTVINSTITAYNTSNNYYIVVDFNASLNISDSNISYAGYDHGYPGVLINTENATITNSVFDKNYYGVYLTDANNTLIYSCRFINSRFRPIHIKSSINVSLINNTIENNNGGVFIFDSSNIRIINNTISND